MKLNCRGINHSLLHCVCFFTSSEIFFLQRRKALDTKTDNNGTRSVVSWAAAVRLSGTGAGQQKKKKQEKRLNLTLGLSKPDKSGSFCCDLQCGSYGLSDFGTWWSNWFCLYSLWFCHQRSRNECLPGRGQKTKLFSPHSKDQQSDQGCDSNSDTSSC